MWLCNDSHESNYSASNLSVHIQHVQWESVWHIGFWWFCCFFSHGENSILWILPSFILTHVPPSLFISFFFPSNTKRHRNMSVTKIRKTCTNTFLAVEQFKSANTVTWKCIHRTAAMQLTPSTGSLLPWQHTVGWLSEMSEKPFSLVTSGDM